MINSEKRLLILGIPAKHQGRAVKHEDVTVISMNVGRNFTGDDILESTKAKSRQTNCMVAYRQHRAWRHDSETLFNLLGNEEFSK